MTAPLKNILELHILIEDEEKLQIAIELFKIWCDEMIIDARKQYGFLRDSQNEARLFISTSVPVIEILQNPEWTRLINDLKEFCPTEINDAA